jgi:hypothetical protein
MHQHEETAKKASPEKATPAAAAAAITEAKV